MDLLNDRNPEKRKKIEDLINNVQNTFDKSRQKNSHYIITENRKYLTDIIREFDEMPSCNGALMRQIEISPVDGKILTKEDKEKLNRTGKSVCISINRKDKTYSIPKETDEEISKFDGISTKNFYGSTSNEIDIGNIKYHFKPNKTE